MHVLTRPRLDTLAICTDDWEKPGFHQRMHRGLLRAKKILRPALHSHLPPYHSKLGETLGAGPRF
ncbi:hypothetical protein RSAG8_11282, partial [Rhizoctonia solani AG-8 WAC10335]